MTLGLRWPENSSSDGTHNEQEEEEEKDWVPAVVDKKRLGRSLRCVRQVRRGSLRLVATRCADKFTVGQPWKGGYVAAVRCERNSMTCGVVEVVYSVPPLQPHPHQPPLPPFIRPLQRRCCCCCCCQRTWSWWCRHGGCAAAAAASRCASAHAELRRAPACERMRHCFCGAARCRCDQTPVHTLLRI